MAVCFALYNRLKNAVSENYSLSTEKMSKESTKIETTRKENIKKGLITSPKTTVITTTTKETTVDDALSFEKDDQLVDEETEARIIFN
ncbi:Oidioi.mRNA.OKI2018_I69.XSR.g15062.t1.cds [Oikopleura dioica]|uniref:Oidioi.mRNA.OKI2018_I69.XSR.g15062.t1.cds n=1 Tax=Oikopleura dioica TaxID=34765 RepID=A0ABN7SGP7_OIKDI|nr:Oidioi.mRNA.OKI2018_I69.XSR.g15062.t1.cds [Oikopleura dioica]